MNRPRRVAYLLKTFPKLSETFILGEIVALRRRGTDVRIVALERGKDRRMHAEARRLLPDVCFVPAAARRSRRSAPAPMPTSHQAAWQAGTWAASWLMDQGVDHVHAHFAGPAATAACAASAACGVPFSFTAHAKDVYSRRVPWPWLRHVAARASAVVTVCEYNRRFLVPRLPGARIERVWNGVDLGRWQPPRGARRPCHVVSVGRLVEKKGFHVLIESVARVRAAGLDARLTIVGEGVQRPRLESLVRRLGLGGSVRFAGERTASEVRRLMRRATLVALACLPAEDGNQDALPTVLLEAGACGTPCIAGRVAGVPEIVLHGRTGLVVPPGDVASTADAIEVLLRSPRLRAAMGRAARRHVAARFDRTRAVRALERIFASTRGRSAVRCA